MKLISVIAVFAIVVGLAMVREGQVANSVKAENREGLILYGILICSISCVWLGIHGGTAMLRRGRKKAPPDSGAT